jgi:PadR family transcriptional regulator, regulatory protein PadR
MDRVGMGPDGDRQAKYYRLMAAGRRELNEAEKSFDQLVKGVRAVLRYA